MGRVSNPNGFLDRSIPEKGRTFDERGSGNQDPNFFLYNFLRSSLDLMCYSESRHRCFSGLLIV